MARRVEFTSPGSRHNAMTRVLHRLLALSASVALTACTSPTSSGSAPIADPSGGDSTHRWVMQQTSNGDSTVGGTVQPLYGPTQANATSKSGVRTAAVLTSGAPRPRSEVSGFAFGNSSL